MKILGSEIAIPLTPEILEKNGFIKDGYTNLSPDYCLETKEYCICVNLTLNCDKRTHIICENKLTGCVSSIDEERSSPNRKQLYVQDLKALMLVAGINKEIIV